MWQELSVLLPTTVFNIHMIGPNISSAVDGQVLTPRTNFTVTLHSGLYHNIYSHLATADLVIGKSHLLSVCLHFLPFLIIFCALFCFFIL